MKKLIIRVLIGLIVLAFLGYAGGIVYLLTQETQLTFYETYGKPLRTVPPDSTNLKYQGLYLQSEDGVKLSGWVVLSKKDTLTSPWLLFCHGNASDISHIDYIARYKLFTTLGLNVLTFDYRGFGESEGTPSEAGLYKDAMAIYNYLTITRHIPLYILIEKYTTFSLKSIPLINSNPLLWQRSSNTKQDDKYGYETRDYEALFTRGRQRAKNCA